MAQHAPTLLECRDWVMEHCTNLLKTTVTDHNDYLVAIDSTRIFVNALDAPLTVTLPLRQNLDALTASFQTETDTDTVVKEIKSICEACTPWLVPVSYIRRLPTPGPALSKYCLEDAKVVPHLAPSHYTSLWPNHLNEETTWFRQYFVGNPYITLVGPLSHDDHPSTALGLTAALEYDDDPSDDDLSYAIITIVQENIKTCASTSKTSPSLSLLSANEDEADSDEYPNTTTKASIGVQYRLVIRNKKNTIRCVLSEATVRNTLARLEARGQGDRLEPSTYRHDQKQKQKRRPLRSFSSAIIHHTTNLSSSSSSSYLQRRHQRHHYHNNNQGDDDHHDEDNDDTDHDDSTDMGPQYHQHQYQSTTNNRKGHVLYRLLYAAVISVYNDLDLQKFKALSAETTILAGLEKELLRFDEMEVPKNYKFGLLSVQDDQSSEEDWFSNTGLSDDLEQFLNILGERITLQGYKGYAAGLDTKCGESGKYSYATTWKENEIMFHVGPLMPYHSQDKQQVHRKRYIGNDIVCIVFMETNQSHRFDPGSIRSQFLHVFIVVHPETLNGKKCWRVEVVSNKNVQVFGPPIPSPPLFFAENELCEFLILKMVSAENAALQSDKFSIPNAKARQGIFKTLVDMGLAAAADEAPITLKQKYPTNLLTSSSLLRSSKNGLDGYLAMKGSSNSSSSGGGPSPIQSNGSNKANKSSNNSFYPFHENNNTPQRPKSAGPTGRNYSRASMRSLRAALESPTPQTNVSSTNSTISLVSPSSSSSSSSSSLIALAATRRSLTPDPSVTTTTPSSSSSSILFPYSSRSNMLRDLKNLARRRHSTASTGATISRTPTPSSIDRPPRTDSPLCHSPIYRTVESPISWIDEGACSSSSSSSLSVMDTSAVVDGNGNHDDQITAAASSSSMNHNTATTGPSCYSPPSPPPTTSDMMKWTAVSKSGEANGNHSIRSRAHHLMSTVMMGRRKQQQQTTSMLSTSPSSLSSSSSSTCSSSLTHDNNNNNNNNTTTAKTSSSSMISRMSRSKSSYLKD
ncbi:hypothetical protein BCR42DRAFT_418306 [Absidia repens]|uniref:Rap-GAP domain-containing protein n=1 Tax=Absidia repens TaxID=90262 RepID=A0A1X2IDB0_9FUNG|nr:hypothetical protein BCR42DRAFT_418306 [Absidia repens]